MPFPHIMGKRESLNLEQLRKQEWGQDYLENITPSHARPTNGEPVMVSTPTPLCQSVDWGDEKVDGAIYHILLKKVRYHTTTKLPFNESVSHLEWETQKRRRMKAGSLVKLVEHLCPTNECIDDVDPGYLIAFLTMHQTFSSAEEVVALLFDRFRKIKESQRKSIESTKEYENFNKGIIKVLLVWLERIPGDLSFKLLRKIQNFTKNELKENMTHELVKKTNQILQKVITPFDSHEPTPPLVCDQDDESIFLQEPYELLHFETTVIAEQLTLVDAELFKSVVPQHCVGCIWSRRDKNDNRSAGVSSVKATVNQFNAVSHRVTTTILVGDSQGSPGFSQRVKRIEAWIQIAQECRDLKNFSSLKAIVSALKSVPIHRLKKTWSSVSRQHISSLEDLSKLVSEDGNQKLSREVLHNEGTAKTAEIKKKSSLTRKQSQKNPKNGFINGTVPYLGTFLTDLMMLDSANSDFVDGNLINFEKRRKEFQIIIEIKLFQEAAKNYYIQPNKKFRKWFDSIETLTEDECFTLSCALEANSIHKKTIPYKQGSLFRSRTLKSENDLVRLGVNAEDDHANELNHKRQDSSSSCASEGSTHQATVSGLIIRVSLECKTSCNLYKSIWVSQSDRTTAVIKSCLLKHNMDEELPKDYDLVQYLGQGNEVTIPKSDNVYYATNTKKQPLSFVLRKIQQ